MKLRLWAVAALLVTGLFSGAAAASAQQLAIYGKVSDQQGHVADVRVAMASASNEFRETTTDVDGAFRFDGVSPGAYKLSFIWGGREVATRAITVIHESREIDVALSVEGAVNGADPFHPSSTVVVIGTRSATEADTAPISTSIITSKEIEARPLRNVDQQLTLTEGVYVQRLQGMSATDSQVSVRGFNNSARTLVLLDGQPLNDSYTNGVNWTGLPIDEVDSIEVARGPYSSLYGGNALGGVINIRTRPVERRQLSATAEAGTYGTTHVSVRAGDRFMNRLGVSVGYESLKTDGYNSRMLTATPGTGTGTLVTGAVPSFSSAGARVAIIGEGGNNRLDQHAFRAKGEYSIGQASVATFQYLRTDYEYSYTGYKSYLRDASGAVIDTGAVVYDDNGTQRRLALTNNNFLQGPGEQHNNFYSGTYQHAFRANSTLRVDAGYYDVPLYEFRSLGTGDTLTSGPGTITSGIRHTTHANAQYTHNVAKHSITFGAETRHEFAQNTTFGLSNWTVRDSRLSQTYLAAGKSDNESGYVQDQIAVSPRLTLVLGGRFDAWKGHDGVSDTFNALSRRTEYATRTNNQLNGKFALGYTLPADWNVRVSAGTSFRNPNVSDLYATSVSGGTTIFASNPSLVPETVKSWETGVRKRFGAWTNVDVAYYEDRVKNLIYRTTDLSLDPAGNYRINQNAGAGRTRGFESVIRQQIVPGIQLRITYTHTQAAITDNPGNPAIVGRQVTFIPKDMASSQLLLVRGKWLGSAGGHYVGRLYSTDLNTDGVKGVPGSYSPYFAMDASAGYNVTSRLQVYVNSENLLNRRYFSFYRSPGRMVFGGVKFRL